jgi:hypothetical protein
MDDGDSWDWGGEEIFHIVSCVGWNGQVFCVLPFDTDICYTTPDASYNKWGVMPVVGNWSSVCWNGKIFCALLNMDTIGAISKDGLVWEQVALPSTGPGGDVWYDVKWNGTYFMILGWDMENTILITAISLDGKVWTDRNETLVHTSSPLDPKLLVHANRFLITTSTGEGGEWWLETSANRFNTNGYAFGLNNQYYHTAIGRNTYVSAGRYNSSAVQILNDTTYSVPLKSIWVDTSLDLLPGQSQSQPSMFDAALDLNNQAIGSNSYATLWTGSSFLILTVDGVLKSKDLGRTWYLIDYTGREGIAGETYPTGPCVVGNGIIEEEPPAFWTELQQTKQSF